MTYSLMYRGNTSSRSLSDSEASASGSLKDHEEMFPLYKVNSDVDTRFKYRERVNTCVKLLLMTSSRHVFE